jgi:hypothetical protein
VAINYLKGISVYAGLPVLFVRRFSFCLPIFAVRE